MNEIRSREEVEKVVLDEDMALLAVVGRNMVLRPGISGKIFAVFGEAKINIKAIAQDTQELSIIVGVSNDDFVPAIQAIYNRIVKS
jgi:aspartate kinase